MVLCDTLISQSPPGLTCAWEQAGLGTALGQGSLWAAPAQTGPQTRLCSGGPAAAAQSPRCQSIYARSSAARRAVVRHFSPRLFCSLDTTPFPGLPCAQAALLLQRIVQSTCAPSSVVSTVASFRNIFSASLPCLNTITSTSAASTPQITHNTIFRLASQSTSALSPADVFHGGLPCQSGNPSCSAGFRNAKPMSQCFSTTRTFQGTWLWPALVACRNFHSQHFCTRSPPLQGVWETASASCHTS